MCIRDRPYTLTSIWQNFTIEDVQPAAALEKPVTEESIEITTFSGLILQAQLLKAKGQYWVAFSAKTNQRANTQAKLNTENINAYKPWVYRLSHLKTSLFKISRSTILATP